MTLPTCSKTLAASILLAAAMICSHLSAQPAGAADRGADRFMNQVRQLTFEGRRSGECYFSPDGSKLLFMSEREPGNPFFQIYMLDFETGDVTRVSTGVGPGTTTSPTTSLWPGPTARSCSA